MIIKVISTQSYIPALYPETNGRPWYIQHIPDKEKRKTLDYLKTNAAAKLLKYEIIEQ